MRPAAAILPVLLAACGSAAQPLAPAGPANVLPTGYRQAVLEGLKVELRDPTGVRNASISKPFLRNMGVAERYVVCVRFNARTSSGGYAGIRDVMAVYVGGRLHSFMDALAGECRSADFEPFPELERIR